LIDAVFPSVVIAASSTVILGLDPGINQRTGVLMEVPGSSPGMTMEGAAMTRKGMRLSIRPMSDVA
jgi:hypothetical protein